ncbi:hypothetical protein CYMTET_48471 [Cymbomonas tetramitiformis]|uniref:Uncharacterized protein n=1 Tax=Cymbomonas tetramitiformis TaxID=36881 RepID=A0AAE0BSB8_9CHLO|nr:hypothetical protein CYMTET_48471 [Cymbomonas tetramitiformis]
MSAANMNSSETNVGIENQEMPTSDQTKSDTGEMKRDSSGRFMPSENNNTDTEKKQTDDSSATRADDLIDIADIVDGLCKDVPLDKQRQLAGAFEKMTKMQMDMHKQLNVVNSTNKELKDMYEQVRKEKEKMMEERKTEFGDMATQITDALSDIYMQYNGHPMDDCSKDQFNRHLCNNQDIAKTLRGLPAATVAKGP